MKRLALLLLVFLPGLSAAQLGAKAQQGKLYGIWVNNEMGFQMTLMLNQDGTGELDGEAISFKTDGTKLLITGDGELTTYNFNLQNDILTVSGGDLEKPMSFQKQQGEVPEKTQRLNDTPTLSQDKLQVPKNLVGKWTGYNESIEFRNDGQCVFQGQTIPFTVNGNQITLQSMNGNVMMLYTIAGSQITFVVNGQNLVYTKAGAPADAKTTQNSTGIKNLDMTLVGKWCYINVYSSSTGGSSSTECITIKQDGTYDYYSESSRSVNNGDVSGGTASQSSDSGTWWVQGDRIHYQSQTQGQGSYQLVKQNHPKNGDPMIVLDGKTYVTYYKKNPW